MKYDQRKTELSELTRHDIESVGASIYEFQPVLAFREPTTGGHIYIPLSVLRYYNPKVNIAQRNIRYLNRDTFEARIKDSGDNESPAPSVSSLAGKAPAYGSFAWIKIPVDGGTAFNLSGVDVCRMLMLLTTTSKQLMIADDIMVEDLTFYLSRVLQLAETTVQNTLRTLSRENIVYKNEAGEWLFYDDRIRRGDLTKREADAMLKTGYRFMRMYFPAIMQMYRDPEMQKGLKYLLPMLPYLHKDYNVFCLNPDQEDPFLVAPLTGAQLCAAGGYETNAYSELTNIYMNSFIKTSLGTESLMVRLKEPFRGIPVRSIMLNPRIFYAGKREIANELEPLFVKQPKKHRRKRRKKAEE